MILFISDFDLTGSGYMNIAVSLCNELATKHGYRVTALGMGYQNTEHNWPFAILPVDQMQMLREIPAMIHNFRALADQKQWHPIEAIVVALDIPLQEKMLQIDRGTIPYIGILPIESGPLTASWASSVSLMSEPLIISEFGTKMVKDAGVPATYMPIGLDTESWRPPGAEERIAIRESLGFTEDDFVVLTVADNQERKNLAIAMEIMARSRKHINSKWVLVSRLKSPVGWKLSDLAMQFDMTDHYVGFERGLPFDRLWILYAAADVFLLTSKAEGLCLPVLEAMATDTPVLAVNSTAIPEHIYAEPDWSRVENGMWESGKPQGQRGFTIPVEYATIDPWGNSMRSFPNPREGAKRLVRLANMKPDKLKPMVDAARIYAQSRTWDKAGLVLAEAIKRAVLESQPTPEQVETQIVGLPATAPRPIPPMYAIPDQGEVANE